MLTPVRHKDMRHTVSRVLIQIDMHLLINKYQIPRRHHHWKLQTFVNATSVVCFVCKYILYKLLIRRDFVLLTQTYGGC